MKKNSPVSIVKKKRKDYFLDNLFRGQSYISCLYFDPSQTPSPLPPLWLEMLFAINPPPPSPLSLIFTLHDLWMEKWDRMAKIWFKTPILTKIRLFGTHNHNHRWVWLGGIAYPEMFWNFQALPAKRNDNYWANFNV